MHLTTDILVGPTKYSGGSKGVISIGEYALGGLALFANDPEDGEPLFTATVYLDEPPSEGCVWLKGWSENEGVPQALYDAGIVEFTGRTAQCSYATAIEGRLSKEILELVAEYQRERAKGE